MGSEMCIRDRNGDKLFVKGEVLRPDGSESFPIDGSGSVGDAVSIGEEAGLRLKSQLSDDFVQSLHQR